MKAYAKINLALDIVGRRPDGYHELSTVMQRISLADEVTLSERGDGLSVRCDTPGVPTDESNIVCRIASAFSRHTGIDVKGICFTIRKNIPSGAGLGGGSSDGAAALELLDRHFGTQLTEEEKIAIAAPVGADIPFFIYGQTALCEGIGERITPLQPLDGHIVVIKPPFSISTPAAFAAYDALEETEHPDIPALCAAIRSGDLRRTAALLGNSLQRPAAARYPRVEALIGALIRHGALGAAMTGSGSAVFGIFKEEKTARRAADLLAAPDLAVFHCRFL